MPLPSAIVMGLFYFLSEVFIGRARRTKDFSKDSGSLRTLWFTIQISLMVGIATAYAVPAARIHPGRLIYPAGFGLFALGLVLRWWAIIHLGRFFTVNVAVATDHRVVDSGPYRYIRHPSYTGGLLAFLGISLCLLNALSIPIIMIPIFLAFRKRIGIEEAVLTTALEPNYREYIRRTKRLIPFVY
ncbi:MAG TPA: isoprenylcysteine carboxylmethyltransferase family protein [Opitutaceae bacterium]|jgi:protein-S-isoprenylcysteine O-methyltransferase|nr:isoprenylcysteine carboxylmethyltransferase family protein [Opitutaceae bacterium]